MARLCSVGLRFGGEFRDLWLYKGHLYCWQRDGAQFYAELDAIVDYVQGRYGPGVANAVQVLVTRNDWKASEQFRTMMASPPMLSAFLEPFRDEDQKIIELPPWLLTESKVVGYSGLVLDTTIYADNVFFGTSEGLLQTFISPEEPEREFGIEQVGFDSRVSGVSVRYSAVNVSAQDKGLHFARLDPRATVDKTFAETTFHEIAKYSRQTSYAAHDLLNYGSAAAPDLHRAHLRERDQEQDEQRTDRYEILGYSDPVSLEALTYSAAVNRKRVTSRSLIQLADVGDMEVLGNNGGQFLLSWNDRFRVVRMSVGRDYEGDTPRDIQAGPSSSFKDLQWSDMRPSQTLQTLPVNRGFVVEQMESVALIQHDGIYQLSSEPVAQLRTFASSLRHKEVVASVEEESATIMGYYLVDETLF